MCLTIPPRIANFQGQLRIVKHHVPQCPLVPQLQQFLLPGLCSETSPSARVLHREMVPFIAQEKAIRAELEGVLAANA